MDEESERRRRALAMLSGIGAALAGLGAGVLLGPQLSTMAWPILAVGATLHLWGMIGTRRLTARSSYALSALDQAGYWICWLLLAGLAIYAAVVIL